MDQAVLVLAPPPKASRTDADVFTSLVWFWRQSSAHWFSRSEDFDRRFRDNFLSLHEAVAGRRHDEWIAQPHGALALVILTDEFPRHAFRGTPRMYATDDLARRYARQAIEAG
ncbi:DUF924 family protein [Rhodopseudomonas sp.]|uniref:DUF924 family protein n=1 Tax=Rhodopseudomonas sp. TaxID=1078 RepID=UPI0039E2CC56